jgi:hypothetical protein
MCKLTFPWVIGIGFCAPCLLVCALGATEFKLAVESLDASRRPTLLLSGLQSGDYGLDASTNLTTWFRLLSTAGTNGQIRYQHAEAVQFQTLYYRGVQLANATNLVVVPQVDSNVVAVAVITPETGGALTLTNDGGTRFTFRVGPSNVIEPVAITMQLVTNFSAFPAENSMRSAILFQPDGFTFHGAGLLEIQYPTNVPHLKLSSFAFNGDGGGFHLTPDVVATNRVQIPVTHFSGVGTALWEPGARTRAITTNVENTRDYMAQQLAEVLGLERERQLLGQEPDPSVFDKLISKQQEYYDKYLQPYFAEAARDCALARFLIREVLGIERQSQLLGMEAGPGAAFLSSTMVGSWMCNCASEALKACEEGKISDQTLIRTLLGMERQAQLLGSSDQLAACGLGSLESILDKAANQKLPCVTEWFGVVSYSDGGSRSWDCSGSSLPGDTCTASTATSLRFDADVDQVTMEDNSFPPFFYSQTWRLKLLPEASATFAHKQVGVKKYTCGAVNTTRHSVNGSGSGRMEISVEFTFEDGKMTDFILSSERDLQLRTVDLVTSNTTPCDAPGSTGSSSSNTFPGTSFMAPESVAMDKVTLSKQTATEIMGTVRGTRIGMDAIPMPFSWDFSLRRRPAN